MKGDVFYTRISFFVPWWFNTFNTVCNCNKGTKFVMILSRLCFCSHHVIRNTIVYTHLQTHWPLTSQQHLTTAAQLVRASPNFYQISHSLFLPMIVDRTTGDPYALYIIPLPRCECKKFIITSARYWKFKKTYQGWDIKYNGNSNDDVMD